MYIKVKIYKIWEVLYIIYNIAKFPLFPHSNSKYNFIIFNEVILNSKIRNIWSTSSHNFSISRLIFHFEMHVSYFPSTT